MKFPERFKKKKKNVANPKEVGRRGNGREGV